MARGLVEGKRLVQSEPARDEGDAREEPASQPSPAQPGGQRSQAQQARVQQVPATGRFGFDVDGQSAEDLVADHLGRFVRQ